VKGRERERRKERKGEEERGERERERERDSIMTHKPRSCFLPSQEYLPATQSEIALWPSFFYSMRLDDYTSLR